MATDCNPIERLNARMLSGSRAAISPTATAVLAADLDILHSWRIQSAGDADPFHSASSALLNSAAVAATFAEYGTYLLPQAFPEGSPTHPCYPTGHGTVGGACITALKFFFDGNQPIRPLLLAAGSDVMQPNSDGTALVPYTGADRDSLAGTTSDFQSKAGYQKIQQTRPQTLGYALTDSPAGQLAWNAELWTGWGDYADYLDVDTYLTHVSIYWFTRTGVSSARHYYEDARSGAGYRDEPNRVPTAVAVFPQDFRTIRTFAERANHIVRYTEFDRGGHFAALERPEELVTEIREFFRPLRAA